MFKLIALAGIVWAAITIDRSVRDRKAVTGQQPGDADDQLPASSGAAVVDAELVETAAPARRKAPAKRARSPRTRTARTA